MLTTIFPPAIGGPATQCYNLCKALVVRNIVPIVVTYGDTFKTASPEGYPVYMFRRHYGFGLFDRIIRWIIFPFFIARLMKKEKVQLLHCHSVNMLSFTAGLVAKIFAIPTIIKFAGDWVWETLSTDDIRRRDFISIYTMSPLARVMTEVEKIGLKLFDAIWTPSAFREQNVRYLLGAHARTVRIPNALLFTEDDPVRQRKKNDTVRIVSANRFIPHKRIPMIIDAFNAVKTEHTELILIGGGDAGEVAVVKKKIQALGIETSVTLTGVLSSAEVYKIFQDASFYVSASLEEGFPNVFIEAMHYALPIVATDVGGSNELVVDGKTGFLVPPHETGALAEKMRMLISNAALRKRMGENAYERSKFFNLEHRIGEFISLYERLISRA